MNSKQWLRILAFGSAKALFQYKSFFLLILLLIAVDRLLHDVIDVREFRFEPFALFNIGPEGAAFVFREFPSTLRDWVFDYRVLLVAGGLFLVKQIISLWPSSDMRRMHRGERRGFGLISALLALRGRQVLWDAVAVGSICCLAGAWMLVNFFLFRRLWLWTGYHAWSVILAGSFALLAPLLMAGFSYSSKIAVLSQGRFAEKLNLFYRLFMDPAIFFGSWLFFGLRIVVEAAFVVAIPGYILLTISSFVLRILLAGICATLVYSYLKMVSFKFFLFVYRKYPLVEREYQTYFDNLSQGRTATGNPDASGTPGPEGGA